MKYKVGDKFVANKSGKVWDGDKYKVEILEIKPSNRYNLLLVPLNRDYGIDELELSGSWLDEFCSPLTKLDKLLD